MGMDKLPVYEMVINDAPESDVEVSAVAFVDKPAIEKNFLAFKSDKLLFAVDPEQRIVSGPAMVADQLIYRKDENGEYNVFFSKDTIKQIALKFFKKDYQKNLNLFHDPNLPADGVTIFESFVSDESRGVQPMKGFEDLPDGSWFISAKVENDLVWSKVKDGTLKGFSVEGIFSYIKKPANVKNELRKLWEEVLNDTKNENRHLLDIEGQNMSKVKDILAKAHKEIFGEIPVVTPTPQAPQAPATQFMDYTTKDGKVMKCDKLEVGGVAMMGETVAPAGNYEFQDGTKVTIGDGGQITAVSPAQQMSEPLTEDRVRQIVTESLNPLGAQMKTDKEKAEADLKKANEKLSKQEEVNKTLFNLIEQMAQIPATEPVETSMQSFKKKNTETRDEKLAALTAYFKNRKTA